MYSVNYLLLLPLIFIFYGCNNTPQDNKQPESSFLIQDPHSYSGGDARVKHLDLEVEVDFNLQQVRGVATWQIEKSPDADKIILDIFDLHIDSVTLDDGSVAEFDIGTHDKILGSPLSIRLKKKSQAVSIYYHTGKNATALQWLAPEQTFDKKHPFVYTQSQSIYARTWLPCQDGPGIRFTYEAKVTVPPQLMALMSAENPKELSSDGRYTFRMEQPIPAYLMALAVGDVQFKSFDERSGVYAESSILERSWKEFNETGKMIEVAERLYGKYAWKRYDILVLPLGFPFGGMENPILTFCTPTILAGDKSLVNLIAHELAHSWSGNLVTNETWNDFWLNEGFTVYFERRITEEMHGKDYADMLWELGYQDMKATIQSMGNDNPDTRLKLDLQGRDPGVGLTDIAYEKGAAFLLLLENTVGRTKWDSFVNGYFKYYAFNTINTDEFLNYLDQHLLKGHNDWKEGINIQQWVFEPGLPGNFPRVDSVRFQKVTQQINEFVNGSSAKSLDVTGWSTYEWLQFLRNLPSKLSLEQMYDLDNMFEFTKSKNSEIAAVWFVHAIRSEYKEAYPFIQEFLYHTGRQKFLEQLYGTLVESEHGRIMAKEIFDVAKGNYHPLAQKAVAEILNP